MNQSLTIPAQGPREESFDWGRMTWLLDAEICAGAGISLAGKVELRIGDECRFLEAGKSALISAGQPHSLRNPGRVPAVLMIAYGSGTRRYDPL